MEFFNNHKSLFLTAFLFFLGLTILVAIMPALHNQENNAPLPNAEPLSAEAVAGKNVYIANGCVGCHTQQVRNVAMDKVWGDRPNIAADYADIKRTDFFRNTATLMGTERTGPDLTNIGVRQPSKDWQLLHLYNPRAVVRESIMPAYPWMFEVKDKPAKNDVVVTVPDDYRKDVHGTIIATKDALNLVAYLQSLKQTKLPDGNAPDFLYQKTPSTTEAVGAKPEGLNGKLLYATNCQSCHQANGEGLKGAFPPLKGSPVVDGDDLNKYVDIILHGYDAREEYGVMPPVGVNAKFTENEIAAIINYERTSWGNTGKKVTPAEIKKIMEVVNQEAKK
ncbi:cytochrome c oxidase cbb3-type subunit 2 [Pedobacter sp. UYP30]|uniref:cytochrome c n=1 Tax=Pedobacter sp. UYP30 TaxID=1756400 RepID=UPI0033943911